MPKLSTTGTLQKHYESFDGFVVLHGTDTMAYTASALSSCITFDTSKEFYDIRYLFVYEYLPLVRTDMDVNEHERLSSILYFNTN
jgi:hypothetical protein